MSILQLLDKTGVVILEPLSRWRLKQNAELYHQEEYQRILRVYDKPLELGRRQSVIYENIFRILCLLKCGDDTWKSEYRTLQKYRELEILGEHDKKYIQTYIGSLLELSVDEISAYSGYNLESVSSMTKTLFPFDQSVNSNFISFSQSDL